MSAQSVSAAGSGPFNLSLPEFQNLIDTTPSLQIRGNFNAPLYSWVSGTKGVWILENPSNEQMARLNVSPKSENEEVITNGHFRDAGAVFYANYVCMNL